MNRPKSPARLYRYQRRVESTPPQASYRLTLAGEALLREWKAARVSRLAER
jgi:DNA-binding PadR family transcriptional regulator